MSTHGVKCFRIEQVLPHSNADKLEIIPIPGSSWRCVSQKGNFVPGDCAIYVEPDYVVPTTSPAFAWLAKEGDGGKHRLKALRLRGVLSYGLLIKPPIPEPKNGWAMRPILPGDDPVEIMQLLGIERYVIPENMLPGVDNLIGEWPIAPTWGMESLQSFPAALVPNEPVIVTEKVDGVSARYMFKDGVFYVGARTRWLDPTSSNYWTRAANENPGIEAWCKAHPGVILYGEIIGSIKSIDLKYGFTDGHIQFRAFDAYAPGDQWGAFGGNFEGDGLLAYGVKAVPMVYIGEWKPEVILPLAEQDTLLTSAPTGHMMEGIVIQPMDQRRDPELGKVILKFISERYWVTKPPK